ncbi:MAG: hypothetical protein MZW92_46270 [Comamonadaceae bacterium]|nr:hypothetical protein [Comamonadaceae bacterium]
MAVDFEAVKEQAVEHGREIATAAAGLLARLSRSGMQAAAFIMNLVLRAGGAVLPAARLERAGGACPGLAPAAWRAPLAALARETDEVLGAFLRGQLLVMLALATIYSTGLLFVGLDLALPIGITAGLVSCRAVPRLHRRHRRRRDRRVPAVPRPAGAGRGGAGVRDRTGARRHVVDAELVGDRIGLHPVAVIFAILAGGQLFGFCRGAAGAAGCGRDRGVAAAPAPRTGRPAAATRPPPGMSDAPRRQLALNLRLRDASSFENFRAGPNREPAEYVTKVLAALDAHAGVRGQLGFPVGRGRQRQDPPARGRLPGGAGARPVGRLRAAARARHAHPGIPRGSRPGGAGVLCDRRYRRGGRQ